MNRRLLLGGLLGALATPLALGVGASLVGGCGEGRFPVCRTNADCQQRDAGPNSGKVCFDLRCVGCRYDSDCAPGSVCGGTGTCSALDTKPGEDPDGGAAEIRSWDPTNWNECAAGCKDQACLGACDRRFHAK